MTLHTHLSRFISELFTQMDHTFLQQLIKQRRSKEANIWVVVTIIILVNIKYLQIIWYDFCYGQPCTHMRHHNHYLNDSYAVKIGQSRPKVRLHDYCHLRRWCVHLHSFQTAAIIGHLTVLFYQFNPYVPEDIIQVFVLELLFTW